MSSVEEISSTLKSSRPTNVAQSSTYQAINPTQAKTRLGIVPSENIKEKQVINFLNQV